MVEINIEAARAFATEAAAQLRAGAVEDVLRHLLSARLPLMFPDNPWWIQAHSIGAEAHVHFVDATGRRRIGFIDSLVGKTAIEYEKNLTIRSIYDEGYYQVEEYCSALLNRGEPCADIIGVLSDTVHWYAFTVRMESELSPGALFGPNNIVLDEVDSIDLENHDDDNLQRFGLFINRYLGRQGSRQLSAQSLATDLGFDSVFCSDNITEFAETVDEAFSSREHYGRMIASLWKNFVTCFEREDDTVFNCEAYTNELYIMTLAKLLCANILNNKVVDDDDGEMELVLNGHWFKERGFVNLVEYDYFGWLCEPPLIDRLLVAAKRMQNDLAAYDYKRIVAQDLFGSIVAQLADRDRRLLLGQEFTPQWVAKRIVERAIEMLPSNEYPNFVDMCCGSGVFVVETLRQTVARHGITPDHCSEDELRALTNCVVGFDIDPLAVLLAKLNWAMIMREYTTVSSAEMVIPIYHADSLFATAPLTKVMGNNFETQSVAMVFDGDEVELPGFLISPLNRRLFDAFIQTNYEIAKAQARTVAFNFTRSQAEDVVNSLVLDTGSTLTDEQKNSLAICALDLIATLERLQRSGRNGIWPFLLENSYRPGLVREHFNAIVSNPPWMAMSKLANNPYKADIVSRAERYGIKPTGSSHLHAELATVFLLNSVDKYLKDGAYCGVIMPDTLLNGYHHESFRNQAYLRSDWSVGFQLNEIWELPTDTFKNKAVIVFGKKTDAANSDTMPGNHIFPDREDETLVYRILHQGRRTAWSSNPNAQSITNGVLERIPFLQGADIMPRTLVFHKATKQPNGKWSLQPIPRRHDETSYLVSLAKENQDFSLNTQNIDDQFIYECYLSNHVLPFIVCKPAIALLPMKRVNGMLAAVNETELATYGSASSATFERVFRESGESASQYFDRINTRNKLKPQRFVDVPDSACIVFAGAGGEHICAAYVPVSQIDRRKTIIDQTLYWYIAQNEDEAIYICGLLNSRALGEIIADFQPEGAMGRRHIHKLPYEVTPPFKADDAGCLSVVEKTRALIDSLISTIDRSDVAQYIPPSRSTLQVRRSKIREFIHRLDEREDYERACRDVYGV
jgi:hypothetical protein